MAKSSLKELIEDTNGNSSITKFSDNHPNNIKLFVCRVFKDFPEIVLLSQMPDNENIHSLDYNNRLENLEIAQNFCIVTTNQEMISIEKKINTPNNFEYLIVAGVNELHVNNQLLKK